MISRFVLVTLSFLTLTACRDAGTGSASAQLVAQPPSLTFGGVPVGKQRIQHLKLENASRYTVQASLEVAPPFEAPAQVELRAGEDQDLELIFAPETQGAAEAELAVIWEGGRLMVPLSGEGLSSDACAPSMACEDVTWDASGGTCVRTGSADGSRCSNACLREGTCESGICMGTSMDCDDGNVCTVDACDPVTGCAHASRRCPTSSDPCLAAVCDPVTGCSETVVPDGTDCGTVDCTVARVCIGGSCVTRPAVDGMSCGAYSPCQEKGKCEAGSCVRPPKTALGPSWTYTSGDGTALLPGPLSADGHLYALEERSISKAQLTGWLLDIDVTTGAVRYRRAIPELRGKANLLLEGDVLILEHGDAVAGFNRRSGTLLWKMNLGQALQPIWDAEHGGLSPWSTTVVGAFERVPGSLELMVYGYTEDQGPWLVRIDPQTGSLLTWSQVGFDATSPVADESGGFAFEADLPDPATGRTSSAIRWVLPDGGELTLDGYSRLTPLAVYSGTIIWREEFDRESNVNSWSSDGGMRWLDSDVYPGSRFVLGRTGGFGPGFLTDGGFGLLSLDTTGAVRARFPLPASGDFPSATEPLLTSNDEALFAVQNPSATDWLLRFSKDGETFACPLDSAVQPSSTAGLSSGMYLVVEDSPQSTRLAAYDVGPLQLATSGWVCPGGNPQHTMRALP